MVTLLGFFCILANVICLEMWMPDLVGPVGLFPPFSSYSSYSFTDMSWDAERSPRVRLGYTIVLPLGYGCEKRASWPVLFHHIQTNRDLTLRYSTMDNIDGKQARRTGQSSGLGELFE